MIRIYYVPFPGDGTREYRLIKQGLVNNPRIKLVSCEKNSDFIFQFYYIARRREHFPQDLPPEKTVIIDYHDRQYFRLKDKDGYPVKCLAYFKRSWVRRVDVPGGRYALKETFPHPSHYHPLTMAIMDEFIIDEDMERDITLSCTLRRLSRHFNRIRVLELLEGMDIRGKTQIGEFNAGHMDRFNKPDMREYFKLLKRSRIVVTCNPNKWEGDHRTWEAFASGALVFIDKIYTPMVHPLVDGKHCIFYEMSDSGLKILQKKILYFLEETDHADAIARAGHEFTMKYHRASNRIDEILDMIT